MTIFMVTTTEHPTLFEGFLGIVLGVLFASLLYLFDFVFRRFHLRSFNIVIIGLFIGYLMGSALALILDALIGITTVALPYESEITEILKISLFLFGTYLGTIMTIRFSDEIYMSIPFIKFTPVMQKKKDLIVDSSVLYDPRVIDLCSSGLIDNHLVIPRFVLKDIYTLLETGDEDAKERAKKALEALKKMEELHYLALRYNDTDFPQIAEQTGKLIRLARLMEGNILTSDMSQIHTSADGVRIINLHSLANALKPLMQAGEHIQIKIQRLGKEAKQGIGYLEDGTMVVVNGGGGYIGETIDALVLSVKHTTSGRIIFCNAADHEA
ncbi:MAG: hypothetical protein JW769_00470 [Parachlamydiales bacterium]|nr:hypothetical protein [Parachlamydiales bacterium]